MRRVPASFAACATSLELAVVDKVAVAVGASRDARGRVQVEQVRAITGRTVRGVNASLAARPAS